MFASIEVLIGLALVYLLLALIVTALTEWVASLVRFRSRNLKRAIRQMLDGVTTDAPNTTRFFEHPRIVSLSEGTRLPSYVPSRAFAEVVDELASAPAENLAPMPILGKANRPTVDQIEDRFLDSMNRASGWYKRKAMVISVAWSVVVVVVANADTVDIAQRLWASPTLRAAVIAQAERRVAMGPPRQVVEATYDNPQDPVPDESADSAEDSQEADQPTAEDRQVLDQLLGWQTDYRAINDPHCERLQEERDATCSDRGDEAACTRVLDRISQDDRCETQFGTLVATGVFPTGGMSASALAPFVAGHLFGWFLSIAAVSLGAPFWFDTLTRFVNLRGAGPAEQPKNKGDLRSSNEARR